MPPREYLEGLAFFVPVLAACGLAAAVITARRYAHLRGAERALALALLASIVLLAAHVVPLAFGELTRGTVVAAALALAAASLLLSDRSEPRDPAPPPTPAPAGPLQTALAAIGAAAFVVFLVAQLRTTLVTPVTHVDVVSFHLPGIARWIQSGSLWQTDQLFPEHVTAYYPNNGDALLAAVVLPWREVAFARLLPVVFLFLAGLAVYALARRLGAPRPTAVLAGTVLMSVPATLIYALEGLPDAVMLFGFTTGVVFLLRHADGRRDSDLVLAGLGIGLAFGTKWYGLTVTAALFLVWIGGRLLAREHARRVARDAAVLLALIAATAGVWFVRNLVETGNPIYPQEVGGFGITIFDGTTEAAVDKFGYTIVDYLGDPGVLADYAAPGLWAQLGFAGPLILAAVLATVGVAVARRREWRGDRRTAELVAISALALLAAGFWMITPGSAPGFEGQPQVLITVRWLVPAALLAIVVLAALAGRIGRAAIVVNLLLLASVFHGLSQLYLHVSASQLAEAALMVAGLAALVGLAWFARGRIAALPRPRRRALAVAAAVVGAVVVASLMRWEQARYTARGYAVFEPAFAWIAEHAPPGTRIGIAGGSSLDGVSPILPAFGPRLENQVEYVGPFVDDLLRDYEDRDAFVDALRRNGDELLIVGRGLIPRPEARQEAWARSAGYRQVAESRRLALYVAPAAGIGSVRRAPAPAAGRRGGSS